MEISNNINNLNPIKCINQNCFYNNWLASIKQKPQNILSANEKEVLVLNHQLLDQRSTTKQLQSNKGTIEIDGLTYSKILQELLMDGCSIDFFEAAFKHFQELVPTRHATIYFSPDNLLEVSLRLKYSKIATTLATYMQTKHHAIQLDLKHHSLYHALTNDYTNIVNILLDLETIPNEPITCHSTSCWNSKNSCWNSKMRGIKTEEIYNSVFNFITKNLTTCEQQISFLLKLFLVTEYLTNNPDIFIEIFKILTQNLDDAKLLQEIVNKEIINKENSNTKDVGTKAIRETKVNLVILLAKRRETLC
jgi:hypothetical protein